MKIEATTLARIDSALEEAQDRNHRAHLGASQIAEPCTRSLWYSFRWASEINHPARLLRVFQRGHDEEPRVLRLLRMAGVEIRERDQRTGEQFRFSEHGGHFAGSIDAMGKGFIEADGWHLVEIKTSADKPFRDLENKGVAESKPMHFAQMQVYMRWTNTKQAFYIVVNKNDDNIYTERVKFKKDLAEAMVEKAGQIIATDRPPPRISDDPTYFHCKFCNHHEICHGQSLPQVTCRTCIHATPETDGDQRWTCARFNKDLSQDDQRAACQWHRFIPDLIHWAKAIRADKTGHTITYEKPDGTHFHNGPRGACSYESRELAAALTLAGNKDIEWMRSEFDGYAIKD